MIATWATRTRRVASTANAKPPKHEKDTRMPRRNSNTRGPHSVPQHVAMEKLEADLKWRWQEYEKYRARERKQNQR